MKRIDLKCCGRSEGYNIVCIFLTEFNSIFNFYIIDLSPKWDYSNLEAVIFWTFLLFSTVLSTNIRLIESLKLKIYIYIMLISSLLCFWEEKAYKIISFISQKIKLFLGWNYSLSKISEKIASIERYYLVKHNSF